MTFQGSRVMALTVAATVSVMAAVVAFPATAGAEEVIEMLDKTKVAGEIIHYYDGVFTVKAGGNTLKLPKDKIRSISYKLPPARPALGTPTKTFQRWQKALEAGDLETVIDCYALMYQGLLASQVGGSGDEIKKMKEELKGSSFNLKGEAIKGDTATLKVELKKEGAANTADIGFVRENGEWKMLPMPMQ
ncbi:MAG: DUF4878 domain-containing protein [Deltaproteobacteria bacterium]|nr:DUF4878 domain-containing protein [Deltaproteobacteria bacterium]